MMVRYIAKGGVPGPLWYVEDTTNGVVANGTEAEAHIIAWALNQIVEGRLLASADPKWHSSDLRWYHGPTEGVAL